MNMNENEIKAHIRELLDHIGKAGSMVDDEAAECEQSLREAEARLAKPGFFDGFDHPETERKTVELLADYCRDYLALYDEAGDRLPTIPKAAPPSRLLKPTERTHRILQRLLADWMSLQKRYEERYLTIMLEVGE